MHVFDRDLDRLAGVRVSIFCYCNAHNLNDGIRYIVGLPEISKVERSGRCRIAMRWAEAGWAGALGLETIGNFTMTGPLAHLGRNPA